MLLLWWPKVTKMYHIINCKAWIILKLGPTRPDLTISACQHWFLGEEMMTSLCIPSNKQVCPKALFFISNIWFDLEFCIELIYEWIQTTVLEPVAAAQTQRKSHCAPLWTFTLWISSHLPVLTQAAKPWATTLDLCSQSNVSEKPNNQKPKGSTDCYLLQFIFGTRDYSVYPCDWLRSASQSRRLFSRRDKPSHQRC